LLLYTRVNEFCNDMFEISDDEDDQEILRRSPQDTYYLEKIRAFEEAFGIDKLQNTVFKLGEKIREHKDSEDSDGVRTVLTDKDL